MHKLHIMDVGKDATTGRITVEARIVKESESGNEEGAGAVEIWHIEALEIETKYNGETERWLEHIGREMMHRHRIRTAAHTDIQKYRGVRMEIK